MIHFPQNVRVSSFFHIEQIEDQTLHFLLQEGDISALEAKLDSQFFSQKTLHSVLFRACYEVEDEVLEMMLKTRSFASGVVTSIIVDTLYTINNLQGENRDEAYCQIGFIEELLKNFSSRLTVLNRALDKIYESAVNLQYVRPAIERLIRTASITEYDAEQVILAFSYLNKFNWLEPVDNSKHSEYLSDGNKGIEENGMAARAQKKEVVHVASKLSEPVLLGTLPEIKCEIGKFLTIRDILRWSQASREFNKVVDGVIQNCTQQIEIYELTPTVMVTLQKVICLSLGRHGSISKEMPIIGELSNLHELNLGESGVTDSDLSHLENLTNLRSLYLADSDISDTGLPYLKKLTSLEALWLFGTDVTGAGLQHLEELTHLTDLDLSGRKDMDTGLWHLRKLANLRNLDIAACDVTAAGMKHLQELTSLRKLLIYGTDVTDEVLPYLEKLTNLRSIAYFDTKITPDGMKYLMKLLPNLFEG
ncbi:MAG: F-box/LRR-like protein [Solimicrobium sp.]|jgi:hypothetical protein|nr:F-box/LRR-like protein [Solimicrobium sp.]